MLERESSERMARRFGVTLVEVLVVLGLVGVSFAVLLPLVLEAREEVREVTCLDKMRRLTEGVLRYESVNRVLPPGGLIASAPGQCPLGTPADLCYPAVRPFYDRAPMMSWIVLVLPHFDQQKIYDQFDFTENVFSQKNEPQGRVIPALLCTSAGSASPSFRHPTWSLGKVFGKGNYAAFGSPMHLEYQECYPGALGGFTPGEKQGQRLRQIVDGVGSTLALSELRANSLLDDQRGVWALPWNASSLLSVDGHPQTATHCPPRFMPRPDWEPFTPNSPFPDELYLGCRNPQHMQREGMPCNIRRFAILISAPRSSHPGGVNATYLSGRGTFLSDNIDRLTYLQSIATNDGRTIDQTAN